MEKPASAGFFVPEPNTVSEHPPTPAAAVSGLPPDPDTGIMRTRFYSIYKKRAETTKNFALAAFFATF